MVSDLASSMASRKLILFDIDGTLLTPGPVPRQALAEALSHFHGQPIALTFHDVAGFTGLEFPVPEGSTTLIIEVAAPG